MDFPARQGIVVLKPHSGHSRLVLSRELVSQAATALAEEVEDIGFEATVRAPAAAEDDNSEITVVLNVNGMRCMKNCGTPVQNVLGVADLSSLGLLTNQ